MSLSSFLSLRCDPCQEFGRGQEECYVEGDLGISEKRRIVGDTATGVTHMVLATGVKAPVTFSSPLLIFQVSSRE